MQYVLIIHEVEHYPAWKKIFDDAAGILLMAGMLPGRNRLSGQRFFHCRITVVLSDHGLVRNFTRRRTCSRLR